MEEQSELFLEEIPHYVSADLELSTMLSSILERSKSEHSIDDDYEPEGGWDAWCSRVSKKGKIARIIRTTAKNVMAFDWVKGDEDVLTIIKRISKRLHLKQQTLRMYKDWLVYGRFCIEVVYEVFEDKKKINIRKVKIIPPSSIKVFRDSQTDIDALKDLLKNKDGVQKYIKGLKPGSGDDIVGYVQILRQQSTLPTDTVRRQNTQKAEDDLIFFQPDELIYVSRYPDHDCPDGISLLRENYDLIMNKLGYEKSQSIMVKRHIDPKLIFSIPRDQWADRRRIQQEIKSGIKAGMDIFIPDGMSINVLQASGMGGGVAEAIRLTEDEFIAAMGFADSFTSSTSSNRSVGEIQLKFFERDVANEREIFAEIINDQIIGPYIKHLRGPDTEMPEINWQSIVPDDRAKNVQMAQPFVQMMTVTQLTKLMEDVGYPIADEDKEEFKQNVEKVRGGGQQQNPFGGQDPFGGQQGQSDPFSQGTSDPSQGLPPMTDMASNTVVISNEMLQSLMTRIYNLEKQIEDNNGGKCNRQDPDESGEQVST